MSKIKKPSLIIECCREKYSPKDPETYWFFSCFRNDYSDCAVKEMVGNSKVFKTITYELACMKCGCTKIKILKFNKKGGILEVNDVSGEGAIRYLNKILTTAKEIPVRCPAKRIPYGKYLQIYYGYGFVRENKTQPRRLDESHREEFIISQPVIYTDLSQKREAVEV